MEWGLNFELHWVELKAEQQVWRSGQSSRRKALWAAGWQVLGNGEDGPGAGMSGRKK